MHTQTQEVETEDPEGLVDPREELGEDVAGEAQADDEEALQAELEALLEVQAEIVAESSTGLDDLDELLRDSLAIKQEAEATRGLRDKLKRGGLAAEEKAEIENKIREWEARREWDTVANVSVWEHQQCQCGVEIPYFSHIMHQQKHKTSSVTRYVTSDKILTSLPNLVAKQYMQTPMCPACAIDQGFDLAKEDLEWEL